MCAYDTDWVSIQHKTNFEGYLFTEASHSIQIHKIVLFHAEVMIAMRKMKVVIPKPSQKFAGDCQKAAATWPRSYCQLLSLA